eukprot:CAMPEP_0178538838 /NCGR_PEP_ID=MMETSP0697-20121206/190_1 /TAXON_ID=265572 /ORGANISM="Extubocellulus spinifer, Strain CCMP396" /LENGTH=56 /DNA_ID=CAMNT_0020171101 /DNA_START=368 /DNA_END=538 /DNA_ORIENTATION=+
MRNTLATLLAIRSVLRTATAEPTFCVPREDITKPVSEARSPSSATCLATVRRAVVE